MSSIRSGAPAPLTVVKSLRPLSEREMLTEAGHDPETTFFDGPVDRQVDLPRSLYTYKFRTSTNFISATELDALLRETRTYRHKRAGEDEMRARVIVESDQQIGKVDENGGTPELLRRWAVIRAKVIADLERDKPHTIVHAEGGDPVENFWNTKSQGFTNDLDITRQQLTYFRQSLLSATEYQRRCIEYIHGIVGSNHGEATRGVGSSTPANDIGIQNSHQLEIAFQMGGLSGTFIRPREHGEAIFIPVFEFGLGVVHGHQAPDTERWWKNAEFGGTLEAADVLVKGHLHHFNPREVARGRWLLGAPSLDGGSAWLRNKNGASATAGVMTFDIVKGRGVDPNSLRVYTED